MKFSDQFTDFISKERISAQEKDIPELEAAVSEFKSGKTPEERFKAFRLTRGVYGQRQAGVQMVRIKAPLGILTSGQLRQIALAAQEFSGGNLHLTTRQSIQLHYVRVEDAPKIWQRLAESGITQREACGNTVRNITCDALAGISLDEPFDPTPYAFALFRYFLRHPAGQDMGRKIKIAFSASEADRAFTYFHDFGFIPKIKNGKRGFELWLGGGLGAQPIKAHKVFDFLETDKIIPFTEAAIRIFDRYGERKKRAKARMKFLLQDRNLGLKKFLELTEEELQALPQQSIPIPETEEDLSAGKDSQNIDTFPADTEFTEWFKSNVSEQKQRGLYAVSAKPTQGDIKAEKAIQLAKGLEDLGIEEFRTSIDQGFVFRNIRPEILSGLYKLLLETGLAKTGAAALADIIACPGTVTCNLAFTNAPALASELENVVRDKFPELISDKNLRIRLSGCLNSCGQHTATDIGFQGIALRTGTRTAPAQQLVLGGGHGRIGTKLIKVTSKKAPLALERLLEDFDANAEGSEYYADYFERKGKKYFFSLLNDLSDTQKFNEDDFRDFGEDKLYKAEVGVGECAGVAFDLISTILSDASEQLSKSKALREEEGRSDFVIYHAYNSFVIAAKALLLSKDIECNSQAAILRDFDEHIGWDGKAISTYVLQIHSEVPTVAFAESYLKESESFLKYALNFREKVEDKNVIQTYYKA